MSDELKPCPFCDGTDINVVIEGNFSFEECAGCGATSEAHRAYEICTEQRKAAAADKWNTRPAEEALQARITELEAEVTRLRGANRWISVEERLPESETVVIVYDRAKDVVREGYLSSEAGGWCENTWWLRRLHNVTHWMPKVLPEPPEGGEG